MQMNFTAVRRNFRLQFVSALSIALLFVVFCSLTANAQGTCTPGSCVGSAITSGAVWDATNGSLITAHGGQIVLVNGLYYWIGEVDTSSGDMAGINCYSSPDLVTWTFVKDVLPPTTSGDLSSSGLVERPKVVWNESTGNWVMWVHIYSGDSVGYATSAGYANVCGTYTYLGSSQPLGNPSYDIGSFQDTNGDAYLLSSDYDLGIIVYLMNPDYLSPASIVDPMSTWGDYEGAAMFKANGYYYLIMSHETGWAANDDQYSYAPSISGPWSTPVDVATPNTLTYNSQSTFVLPVTGTNGTTYMYMGDRWNNTNGNAGDIMTSPYVWLPIEFTGNQIFLPDYTETSNPTWYLDVATGTWSAPPIPPTYSLAATAAAVTAGSTGTSTVTESVAGGFDSPVTLTVSGLPPGVTAAFVPPTLTGAGTSTLTFTAASTAPAGVATVTVTGTPVSGEVVTTTLQLSVSANGPYTELINDNSGLCLTAVPTEGGQLEQVTCSSSTLLEWKLSTEGSGYYITNEAEFPWVVDVSGGSTSSGGVIDNWVPNGGTNQEWTFTSEGSGYYLLKPVSKSTLCLDVTGSSKSVGALIEQVTCASPVATHQEWKISVPVPDAMTITPTTPAAIVYGTDTVSLTAKATFVSGTPPEYPLDFSVNGGSLQAGTCSISGTTDTCSVTYSLGNLAVGSYAIDVSYPGDANYAAAFAQTTLTVSAEAIATAYTELINDNSGLCLTAVPTEGGQLTQTTCTGSSIQEWTISIEGSGYYITSEGESPWVAEVSGQSKSSGGVIDNYVPNGGTNQEWTFTSEGTGLYVVKNVNSGLCLDVTAAGLLTNGEGIEQITCASPVPTHQEWKLSLPPAYLTITPTADDVTYGGTAKLEASAAFAAGKPPTYPLDFSVNGGSLQAGTCTPSGTTDTCTLAYSPGNLAAGSYTVDVSYPGDANYAASFTSTTLTVNKAPLTVTANNTSKAQGAPNPAFTASYAPFVNGDTSSVVSGAPSFSTTATTSSPAGTYPIVPSLGTLSATNYTFTTFVNGTLSVITAPTVDLDTSASVSGSAETSYVATITVTNTGTAAASNVVLTTATLGGVAGTVLPQNLGNIAGGGFATVTVTFPGSVGADSARSALSYAGTYSGGTFSGSVRLVLP